MSVIYAQGKDQCWKLIFLDKWLLLTTKTDERNITKRQTLLNRKEPSRAAETRARPHNFPQTCGNKPQPLEPSATVKSCNTVHSPNRDSHPDTDLLLLTCQTPVSPLCWLCQPHPRKAEHSRHCLGQGGMEGLICQS